jgi:hypothetical protein
MARLQFTDVQDRPTEFLDLTSLTLDEFQQLIPPFEAAFQAHMRHRSYWIPGAYALIWSENRGSFLNPLKNKGCKEEKGQKTVLDALGTFTTLESKKSLSNTLSHDNRISMPLR